MEKNIKGFERIKTFVSSLKIVLDSLKIEENYHEIVLYDHLLSKTPTDSNKAIIKHTSIFSKFMITNKEAVLATNHTLFKEPIIEYTSNKIYLDMNKIFRLLVDDKTRNVVWDHLLGIALFVYPNDEIKQLVQKRQEEKDKREDNFIQGLFSKIQNTIGDEELDDDDPMQIMNVFSDIMQKGVFTELVNDVRSGVAGNSLRPDKLVNSVQGILGQTLDNGDMAKMNSMMSMLMSGMNQGKSGNNPIDINGMLQQIASGGLQVEKQTLATIEEVEEEKEE